jgi:mannose-6-phosphate isomerase
MRNPIRDYDWGSVSALARLQGRAPSGGHEAELWMGAHPGAPSSLVVPARAAAGGVVSLPEAITDDPAGVLGADVLERFGPRLPFILKILAIAKPLSVQVHPDAERAAAMYRPDGGPYVDAFHKPEMLYALEPTEALFGFRPAAQAVALLERLRCERLTGLVAALGADDAQAPESARLHAALATLLTWPADERMSLVADVATAVARLDAEGNPDYPEAYGWVSRLVGLHPVDPMVLAPLLLDVIRLAPGDCVFVPAGVPHCYLSGLGVEILAASDNVLRSGLTSKAVDIDELLQVIDTRPLAAAKAEVVQFSDAETGWRMPVRDFQLTRIRVPEGDTVHAEPSVAGPQILLCTAGQVRVHVPGSAVELVPGTSAFVTAAAGQLSLSGAGEIFRAAVG